MDLTDREALGEKEFENRRNRNSAGAGDDALWQLADSDVSDHHVLRPSWIARWSPHTPSDRANRLRVCLRAARRNVDVPFPKKLHVATTTNAMATANPEVGTGSCSVSRVSRERSIRSSFQCCISPNGGGISNEA